MTTTRAALYVSIAAVMGVWLSSAASSSMPEQAAPPVPARTSEEPVEGAPGRLTEPGRRLRERLAAAPAAPKPVRNPFEFRNDRPASSGVRPVAGGGASLPRQTADPDPGLVLIGIAVQHRPGGAVRTALMTSDAGELIMAAVGDLVLHRYTVTSVHDDSVEAVDADSGATLRLRLAEQ